MSHFPALTFIKDTLEILSGFVLLLKFCFCLTSASCSFKSRQKILSSVLMESLFCNVVQGIAESKQSPESGAGKTAQWFRALARVALLETYV